MPSDAPISSSLVARANFLKARTAWISESNLTETEIATITKSGRARLWSYDFLRRTDPERLADVLERHGLPPDWTPADAYIGSP